MEGDARLTAIVSTRGRVTLPIALRRKLNWQPGMVLTIEEIADGVLVSTAPPEAVVQDVGATAAAGSAVAEVGFIRP